jgi:hypothetical protein
LDGWRFWVLNELTRERVFRGATEEIYVEDGVDTGRGIEADGVAPYQAYNVVGKGNPI